MTPLHAYLRRSPTARAVLGILRQAALPTKGLSHVLRGRAAESTVSHAVVELRRLGAVEEAYKGRLRGARMVWFWRCR